MYIPGRTSSIDIVERLNPTIHENHGALNLLQHLLWNCRRDATTAAAAAAALPAAPRAVCLNSIHEVAIYLVPCTKYLPYLFYLALCTSEMEVERACDFQPNRNNTRKYSTDPNSSSTSPTESLSNNSLTQYTAAFHLLIAAPAAEAPRGRRRG